jgi:hypothetical protein
VDVRGDILVYLRAVPWFAGADPRGGVDGKVVVDGGSGDIMTVPNGANASAVSGVAWILTLGEVIEAAIFIGYSVSGRIWELPTMLSSRTIPQRSDSGAKDPQPATTP